MINRRNVKAATPQGKIDRARKKKRRKVVSTEKDKGHGGANHLQQTDVVPVSFFASFHTFTSHTHHSTQVPVLPASGTQKRKCANCHELGHTPSKCPHTAYAKPVTPDPDVEVQVGETIGVLDIEFSTLKAGDRTVVHEAAVVYTIYNEEQWADGTAEFHMVVKSMVSQQVAKLCPGLRDATSRSTHTFKELFKGLTTFIKVNDIKWLKAHNGIPADFIHLFYSARYDELDFFGELTTSGLLGFIDPGRIIPLHRITSLQHKKAGKGGITTYSGYQSNEKLFKMANDDKEMAQCGLIPHRALDDAKAERNWLTKLPELTQALYGENPRLQCGVSLRKFQIYAEQYEKHKRFLKRND
jgi:hypothetical protein